MLICKYATLENKIMNDIDQMINALKRREKEVSDMIIEIDCVLDKHDQEMKELDELAAIILVIFIGLVLGQAIAYATWSY